MRLPRRLPLAIAMELGLTGEPMDAERAYQLGLVNRVVPAEDLIEEALKLAESVTANAPTPCAGPSASSRNRSHPRVRGWKLTAAGAGEIFSSPDALEGAVAFAEKRPPQWQLP